MVFTKNATEALNLVANTLAWPGPYQVGPGDEIVITEMEHHSNIVPWQLLCERTGATLRWFGLTDEGRLDLSDVDTLINERTKVVSLTWVSNMLGTVNPVREIADKAHAVGALVVVDASQAVPQMPVDVVASGADLLAFTGHKVVGPTGIGVLWGRREVLEQLPPFLGGGEMIRTVTMERSTYADIPSRFEAGTPPIVEAVGLGAAVEYLGHVGMANIRRHEEAITAHLLDGLASVKGVQVLGPASAHDRGGAVSFEMRPAAPARHQPAAGQPGDRRPRGAPLRQAGPPAVRRPVERPGVVVPLHDAGGDRRAHRGVGVHQEVLQGGLNMSNADLDAMYQEIILDHYKRPQNAGLREPFEAEVHHVNPTCGDEITLRVHLGAGDDPVVEDVSYDAEGCSISQASVSVLTELLIGKKVSEALRIHETFQELMQSKGTVEPDEDVLEDGIAFAGVAKFPARVKCALLGWMAWKDATSQVVAAATDEEKA